ncbi:MAG: hypothetical protein JW966_03160 [Anaerolineae bacterium]|nr:hypothetical protein [Anaerolineae bacterium]
MGDSRRSIFFDEWQACLRSHYEHVIRTQDTITEPTLRNVLLHSGLSEHDLSKLSAHVQRDDQAEDTAGADDTQMGLF